MPIYQRNTPSFVYVAVINLTICLFPHITRRSHYMCQLTAHSSSRKSKPIHRCQYIPTQLRIR